MEIILTWRMYICIILNNINNTLVIGQAVRSAYSETSVLYYKGEVSWNLLREDLLMKQED